MKNWIFKIIAKKGRKLYSLIEYPISIWKQITIFTVFQATMIVVFFAISLKTFNYLFPVLREIQLYSITINREIGNNLIFTLILTLFFVFPYLNSLEEHIFRLGNNEWSNIIPSSLIFGLLHMFFGISFDIALSLALSGVAFHINYKIVYDKAINDEVPKNTAEYFATVESIVLSNTYVNIILFLILVIVIIK